MTTTQTTESTESLAPPGPVDASATGVSTPAPPESPLRLDGELAGRLLRSSRWQQ